MRWLWVSLLLGLSLGLASLAPAASGDGFELTYTFRLTDRQTGAPVSGPIDVQVGFYHQETGANPVLENMVAGVTLQDGVAQIVLNMAPNDYQTVFPSVTQAVWIQITDLTHAPQQPYSRQRFAMAPYAGKVPVQSSVLRFNSTGELGLSADPVAGKFLKADGSGALVWADPPGAASVDATFTSSSAANSPVIIKGAASQTGNLQEWQNSSGTALTAIGADGGLKLKQSDSGAHTVTLKAAAGMTQDTVYVLPGAPVNGKFLTTDASGNLTWDLPTAGVATEVPAAGIRNLTAGSVPFAVNAAGLGEDTGNFVWDNANKRLGIGTATPSEALEVAGDLKVSNLHTLGLLRALPTIVGNAIDLGSWDMSEGSGSLSVKVSVVSTGFSRTKQYLLGLEKNMTAGAWQSVLPFTASGSSANDFDLDVRVNTNTVALRLRRSSGTTIGTAVVSVMHEGVVSDVFTPSSAAGAVATPAATYGASLLTMVGGQAGIGTATPHSLLEVAGAIATPVVHKSAAYTLTAADSVVTADATSAAFAIQLPAASGVAGRRYTVKKTDSSTNAVTLTPAGADTVDGAASFALSERNAAVSVVSDGSGWWIDTGTPRSTLSAQGSSGTVATNAAGTELSFSGSGTNTVKASDAAGVLGLGVATAPSAIQIKANNTQNVVTLDANKVGVGTTSPGSTLEVRGAGSTSATTSLNVTNSAGATSLFVRDDGNVGIGTTNPTDKLHLFSTTGPVMAKIEYAGAETSPSTAFSGLTFKNANGDVGYFVATGANYTPTGVFQPNQTAFQAMQSNGLLLISRDAAAPMVFATGGYAAANERMRIDSSGKLGIGTTAPAAKLHTYSTAAEGAQIRIEDPNPLLVFKDQDAPADSRILSFQSFGQNLYLRKANDARSLETEIFDVSGAGQFDFYGGGAPTVRITSGGKVGIGTTNPASTLDVQGDVSASGGIYSSSTDAFRGQWTGPIQLIHAPFGNGSTYDMGITADGSYRHLDIFSKAADASSYITLSTGATLAERMRITNDGKVGIGSANPAATLDVVGSVAVSGNLTTNTLSSSSDIRIPTGAKYYFESVGTSNALFRESGGDTVLSTAKDIEFNYAQTTRLMTVTSTGKVGIGTTNPGAILHVYDSSSSTTKWGRQGEFLLQNSDATTGSWTGIQHSSPSGAIASGIAFVNTDPSSNYGRIDFATRGASGFDDKVLSIGDSKVGIGTTAPTQKLHIDSGGVTVQGSSGYGFEGNNGVSGGMFASGNTLVMRTRATGGAIILGDPSGNDYMRLEAGKVGIGTASPETALQVNGEARVGSVAANAITIGNDYLSHRWTADPVGNNRFILASHTQNQLGITGTDAGGLRFADSAGNTGAVYGLNGGGLGFNAGATEAMRVASSGYVGIGTTGPDTQLQVGGASSADTKIEVNAGGDQYAGLMLKNANHTWLWQSTSTLESPVRLRLYDASNSSEAISILNANGNVGIGTTAPTSTLVVKGAARNDSAVANAATTTIDFATSNLQYTTDNCGTFDLHNLKNGGSYSFAVQGATSALCAFNAFSGAGTGALTVHMPPDHAATTVSTHTLYTFLVMGTHVYVSWIPGY